MIPTLELNINLNISAVTVIGIIQGIISNPLTGLEKLNFFSKNKARANPNKN
jgi:hypothetical protein